jgi:hypothetical protein
LKITDYVYYPESKKLIYSINQTYHTNKVYEVNYPDNIADIKEQLDYTGYIDFLKKDEVLENVEYHESMSVKYSENQSKYLWTIPYDIELAKDALPEQKLNISDNIFGDTNPEYAIDNIVYYDYNENTNDVIIFYKGASENYIIIEKRNLSNIEENTRLTEKSILTTEYYRWYKDSNIVFYLEENESGQSYLVC